MTALVWIAFGLGAIGAAAAAGEFAFTIAWRRVPLHRGGGFIGRWLSHAPPPTIRRRIAELFPASLLMDRRPAARWQAWYNVHVPAFIARYAASRRAALVTAAILDGLIDATRELVAREAPDKTSEPISYDSFWPILEALEEVAAQIPVNAHETFAEKLLELCTATHDQTVQATTAWIVNELGERTPREKQLAAAITRHLFTAGPAASRGALKLLAETGANVQLQAPPFARQDADLAFTESHVTAMRHVLRFVEDSDAYQLMQSLAETGPKSFRGLPGLVWMACLRSAFHELCSLHSDNDAIRNACIAAMVCSDEHNTCAFLTIEALEPVRDRRPELCMTAMSNFVRQSSGRFDQGIAVCAAEGFEEDGKNPENLRTATNDLLHDCRNVTRAGPLARWIELRLGLRGVSVAAPGSRAVRRVV